MCNQQPSPIVRYGRYRELTATTLWQGKGKFQSSGNSRSGSTNHNSNIGQTSPALLCVLSFSLEGGIDNEKFNKNIHIILFIITMVFLIQIVYNNIKPKYRLIINTVTVYISNHKKKVRGQIISATQYAANKRLGFKLCSL